MQVKIVPGAPGSFSLLVNGQAVVTDESHAVCDQIADELRRPSGLSSEMAEVADSIASLVKAAR